MALWRACWTFAVGPLFFLFAIKNTKPKKKGSDEQQAQERRCSGIGKKGPHKRRSWAGIVAHPLLCALAAFRPFACLFLVDI